jgi:hypothetical protein
MCWTAEASSPCISGVAAMAGVNVNQPRAKANTTGSTGPSCATEHRRLVGGGIGMITLSRQDRGHVELCMNTASKLGSHTQSDQGTCPVGFEFTTKAATPHWDSKELFPSLYVVGFNPVASCAHIYRATPL